MSLGEAYKIETKSPYLRLNIYKGHFATSHAHMNYYIDIASNKARLKEARAIAEALSEHYRISAVVDTILCLDNTEVIGACLAEVLTAADAFSVNSGRDIYVLTPEYVSGSQLFFRDNTAPMIRGRSVLVLAASVVSGYTAESAVEAIRYYDGHPAGICSIFAKISECAGLPVRSVFNPGDLHDYISGPAVSCPMCKKGEKITALVNSFGISAL